MCPQGPTLWLLEDSGRRWGPWCGRQGGYLPGKEGMGTQQKGTIAHWSPQTEGDVGCLSSTLATGLLQGTPRISTFSGNAMPGKTEMSFKQWYHEVQCIKDHYPELVVWESIVRLLNEAAVDMAWYMGPTTSVAHILQKLTVIFGTMTSFNVLMPNFYKVTQGHHKKVPSFTTRLEGTLIQIRLQCPRRVTYLEVQQHLKDHLYHGIHKHNREPIRYLYSSSRTLYSQLMVAAHKVESKNKEVKEKVKAGTAVTIDPREGTTELGHQIAKLMADLTRAWQGNSPASTPNSPRQRGHGRGWRERGTPGHPSSHNGWTGLGQTAPDTSTPIGCGTWTTTGKDQGQNSQGTNARHEGTPTGGTPTLSSALDERAGVIWLGNVPLQPQL